MNKIYLLMLFCVFSVLVKAETGNIILTEPQFKSVSMIQLKSLNIYNRDSLLTLTWKKDTALSKIPLNDFLMMEQILLPVNTSVYKDSITHYELCKKIAKELTEKISADIASENADEKISIVSQLKFEKGTFFSNNLNVFLQNQIFDFFYNNKVMNVLHDTEYVKLLKPKAVYKLLSDTKTENKLTQEILFVAGNSKYKLFK